MRSADRKRQEREAARRVRRTLRRKEAEALKQAARILDPRKIAMNEGNHV